MVLPLQVNRHFGLVALMPTAPTIIECDLLELFYSIAGIHAARADQCICND